MINFIIGVLVAAACIVVGVVALAYLAGQFEDTE